ncbi:MAG: prolyl oligopeptidase family serine peptidase [Phocaeicola sp.]|uniref:S9 family peptidase n=1 Tax=Phocaeicola sp. TaxID=2773926 RepID=UPI003F9F1FCC
MNKTYLILMAAALMMTSCKKEEKQTEEQAPFIGKQEVTIKDGRMTPEVLWAMGRIGSSSVSPDGKKVAYTVAYYSVTENKSHRVIYTMNADGTENKILTKTSFNEGDPQWINNGEQIAFLCNEDGSNQLWVMNTDGSNRHKVSSYKGDIEGFSFSPDGTKVLFIAQINNGKSTAERYPDLPKATGMVIDDLNYKHWDEYVLTIPHPFVADFTDGKVGEATDILQGEPYESPMKPFGGIEQLAWSPYSNFIAYTCRKKEGLAYAQSTDSDIYLYDLNTKQTTNVCKIEGDTDQNMGYDTNPKFSPDGQWLAWQSMQRDGYESDRNRLCVYNLMSHRKNYVTESFESNVDDYVWNNDCKSFYFIGVWHGTTMVYSANFDGDVKKITNGNFDYGSVALLGDQILCKRHSISAADELYAINPTDGTATQLTHENDAIFKQLTLGKVEERWTKTTDGEDMLSWVIYPSNFDPNKKYPTLLFCEGGPQSPVSQFWSYRWNFQIMAANNYIIIAPNRRGLPGFGMKWLEEISGDYAGQCMKDYLSAIDDIAKEPYVDAEHLGCVGASFGGYSVYWLAGNHNKRFKAFIAHDGIFNVEQQYLETEELWFTKWDLGGPYWEKNNPIAQRSIATSPHRYIDNWDTPILCIHGDKDYRILSSQGQSAFQAALLKGIPAELLLYPDENHWVLKPQNGILWQRTFFAWLDKWLKPQNK